MEALLLDQSELADRIIQESREMASLMFNFIIKVAKINLNRKKIKSQTLDIHEMDTHINKWDDKWLLDRSETALFYQEQPTTSTTITEYVTIETFKSILNKLPKNKSYGPDNTPNEFLIHSEETMGPILHCFYNLIIFTGITPISFHDNFIRPIHKNKSRIYNDLKFYRPICLSNAMKKLLEIILKKEVMDCCPSGDNQYAYKPQSSTMDAAHKYMSIVESLGDEIYQYDTIQADVASAFDSLSHSKISEYLFESSLSQPVKIIIFNLITQQQIQLKIGNNISQRSKINQGILQGSVLSPLIFTAVVYHYTKHIQLPNTHLIWYADDLLVLCHKEMTQQVLFQINDALESINLGLNEEKTTIVEVKFVTWLGFRINKFGIFLEEQIEKNLRVARMKLRDLRYGGVFRNSVKIEHLSRAFGSFIRPCIEYGLCLMECDPKIVKKIDAFINRSLRNLCSFPRYFPNDDLRFIFHYDTFGKRWIELISRFHNKLSIKMNQPDTLYYSPKVRMSFTPNRNVMKLLNQNKTLEQIIKRNYKPPSQIRCQNCNNNHKFVNGMYKCHLKLALNSTISEEKCTIVKPRQQGETIAPFLPKINEIQSQLEMHQCAIFTDASLHKNGTSTAAAIIIFHNIYYLKSFKFLIFNSNCD
eukprot:NODE_421_length_7712_cov_1.035597.p1 type:complete len:646 gc:universal NODE_421_length_7712_cov_1.035597:1942-5(-)